MVRKSSGRLRLLSLQLSPAELRVVRALYRSVLRLAIRFDKSPLVKSLLFRSSRPRVSDRTGDAYYSEVIKKIFDESLFLPPNRNRISFSSIVKEELRKGRQYRLDERVYCGFKVIRNFSTVWTTYENKLFVEEHGSLTNVYNFSLLSSPCLTDVPRVFPGTVLVAHPLVQGPLSRAVILLLQHEKSGSYGVVINHPSSMKLSAVVKNLPSDVLDIFSSKLTYYGGPTKRLQCIHNISHLDGTKIPLHSKNVFLYTGGITKDSLIKLSSDKTLADSFYFFTGCCTWNPGELKSQISEGYWIPMEISADDVLKLLQSNESNNVERQAASVEVSDIDFNSTNDRDIVGSTETYFKNRSKGVIDCDDTVAYGSRLRNVGWSCIMTSAGSSCASVAKFPTSLNIDDVINID